jgi:hypothetical protein
VGKKEEAKKERKLVSRIWNFSLAQLILVVRFKLFSFISKRMPI